MKRSKGLTIVGVFYIILGLIGSLPNFIYALIQLRFSFGDLGLMYFSGFIIFSLVGCAFLVFFLSGILVLKLRPLGRKLILKLAPLASIGICFFLSYVPFLTYPIEDLGLPRLLIPVLIALAFFVFNRKFFNHPKIKEQFK